MGSSFENQIEQEQASMREEIINMLIALNQLLNSMQRRLHNDYDWVQMLVSEALTGF